MTHMAPTMVQALLSVPGIEDADLSSLHTLCYSAAPMPLPLLRRGLKLLGPVFLQLYGMTEGGGTTLHKRQHKPDGSPADIKRLGSIGQAAPNVDVKIVDDEGRALPVGEPGEILTRTASHMAGYWNNSAATIAALRDGWYHTGDLGYLDEEGFLYPRRPQEGHDHLRRREHLFARGRRSACDAPGRAGRGGDRREGRVLGRDGARDRRAGRRTSAVSEARADRALQDADRQLQKAEIRRLRRRTCRGCRAARSTRSRCASSMAAPT